MQKFDIVKETCWLMFDLSPDGDTFI